MARPTPNNKIYQPRWDSEDYRTRPKDFYPELADEIIEKVMNGESLHELCYHNRDYPLPGTFLKWMEQEPDYNLKYRKAKNIQNEVLLDGVLMDGRSGTWDAGTKVKAGQLYLEKTDPGRYGPRALFLAQPTTQEDSPVTDHAADLRRKINGMADRIRQKAMAEGSKPNGHDRDEE